jgi:formate dehydrogenase major subunit
MWSAEAIASAFLFGSLSARMCEYESGGDCLRTPHGETLYPPCVLAELLLKWPLIRQLRGDKDAATSDRTRTLQRKNTGAQVARSICPYCAVGCGQLVYHRDNKVISIEGDPRSPISRGHLCPKGSASYELVTHPARATKVKYRAPRSRTWVEIDLASAVDMVADRMWTSRERTFDEQHMHTTGIAHLGGATLDIEENYLIKKLFTAGLGMVCLSNQARI